MLVEEARWLSKHLYRISPGDIFPLGNFGSATDRFRRVDQPYIDAYLFAPARARNLRVVHVDQKAAPGVDLVGNLTDEKYLAQLADQLHAFGVKSVMCCNLLEHVIDRETICTAIFSMVPAGGYIILSVPYRFPYHEDPIDTMYRPSVAELIKLFPGASVHAAKILRASRFVFEMHSDYKPLFWLIVRAALPLYRPRNWLKAVRRLNEIASGYKVTCVILQKPRSPQSDPTT